MKILELEVMGLRSHRGPEPTRLDLDGRPLVAIVGPTGAGKSSLFDAVCFALFGEGTDGGGPDAYRDLSSDGRTELSVRMVFSIGGARYQLYRTIRPTWPRGETQTSKANFKTGEVWLRKVTDDGDVEWHVDQARKVNSRLKSLLGGMDRAQFCQSVLLAQNKFAALLTAPPKDRRPLLDNLLGLTALDQASKAANITRKHANDNLERLRAARALLPADPAAARRSATARITALTEAAAAIGMAAETLDALRDEDSELRTRARDLDAAAELRAGSGQAPGIQRLTSVRVQLRALAELETRLQSQLSELASTRTQTTADALRVRDELESTEQLVGKHGSHPAMRERLSNIEVLHAELPGLRAELEAHKMSVADLDRSVQDLEEDDRQQAAAAQAIEKERALEAEALTELQGSVEARQKSLQAATTLVGELSSLVSEVAALTAFVSDAVMQHDAAGSAVKEARDQRNAIAAKLIQAQRADAAAHAAADCHPGDECPVCSTVLAGEWVAPGGADLAEYEGALKVAERTVADSEDAERSAERETARAANTLQAKLRDSVRAHTSLQEVANEAGAETDSPAHDFELDSDDDLPTLVSAVSEIPDLASKWEAWLAAQCGELKPLQEHLAERQKTVTRLEQQIAEVTAASAVRSRRISSGREELVAARANEKNTDDKITDCKRRTGEALKEVGIRWAALVDLTETDATAAALGQLAADEAQVGKAATAVEQAEATARALGEREQQLKLAISDEVHRPLTGARTTLAGITQLVGELAERSERDAPVPVPDSARASELAAVTEQLIAAAEAAQHAARVLAERDLRAAEKLVMPAQQALSDLADQLHSLQQDDLDLDDSLTDEPLSSAAERALSRLVGSAETALRHAQESAKRAADQVEQADRLDARVTAVAAWASEVSAAAEALRKDRFPAWARTQRTAELFETASELLRTMTNDRYRLADDFRICDDLAGTTRSASTLSGGEQFEAALALALAVADIAGRSGVKFETLFLDEGFAGLDGNNLNRAIEAIESQVATGHSIVLITHIGAVADRIPDVLLVEPDDLGGCTTRWLEEDERYDLGADLDLAVS